MLPNKHKSKNIAITLISLKRLHAIQIKSVSFYHRYVKLCINTSWFLESVYALYLPKFKS